MTPGKPDVFGRDFRIAPKAHPFDHLKDQPQTRACCKDLRALKVSKETSGLWVATCLGCGANHYRMRAEPGVLGLRKKESPKIYVV